MATQMTTHTQEEVLAVADRVDRAEMDIDTYDSAVAMLRAYAALLGAEPVAYLRIGKMECELEFINIPSQRMKSLMRKFGNGLHPLIPAPKEVK